MSLRTLGLFLLHLATRHRAEQKRLTSRPSLRWPVNSFPQFSHFFVIKFSAVTTRLNLAINLSRLSFCFLVSLLSTFLTGISLNRISGVVSSAGILPRILCISSPLCHSPLFFNSMRTKSRFALKDLNTLALTNKLHLRQAGYRFDLRLVPPCATGLIWS